tara:strand:+ start:5265 stop:5792 length:528 start_codon:yes stop_codon:yes gene_type:complete
MADNFAPSSTMSAVKKLHKVLDVLKPELIELQGRYRALRDCAYGDLMQDLHFFVNSTTGVVSANLMSCQTECFDLISVCQNDKRWLNHSIDEVITRYRCGVDQVLKIACTENIEELSEMYPGLYLRALLSFPIAGKEKHSVFSIVLEHSIKLHKNLDSLSAMVLFYIAFQEDKYE